MHTFLTSGAKDQECRASCSMLARTMISEQLKYLIFPLQTRPNFHKALARKSAESWNDVLEGRSRTGVEWITGAPLALPLSHGESRQLLRMHRKSYSGSTEPCSGYPVWRTPRKAKKQARASVVHATRVCEWSVFRPSLGLGGEPLIDKDLLGGGVNHPKDQRRISKQPIVDSLVDSTRGSSSGSHHRRATWIGARPDCPKHRSAI